MYSYGMAICDDYFCDDTFCDDTQNNFNKKNVMHEILSLNTSN